ncbi:MAG: DUF3419 family protein [Nanoarchaeota archaeon]|nr:DUF3419 family protein [Nanoarchaeota archaeon]
MALYTATNENLQGIVAGLDVQSDDKVLAVAGSGDQAFALLEFVARVEVVDTNPAQLSLVARRLKYLAKGDWDNFLPSGKGFLDGSSVLHASKLSSVRLKLRDKYFSVPGRLDCIRERADNLVIRGCVDIFSFAGSFSCFSKVYCSNARVKGVPGCGIHLFCFSRHKVLGAIASRMPVDGLLYVTHAPNFASSSTDIWGQGWLPSSLRLDSLLSRQARSYELSSQFWSPSVYRRV